ncbi:MAG: ZIP family metal transporter [Gemmatimonadota bacterium]|nr:MAG: ZIP family metal transporter [Gemmatimonadota bacterium]
MDTVLLVFAGALLTALATGLGALPFAFVRSVSTRTIAYSNALASGLMLGASFGLVAEGTQFGAVQTILGGMAGVAFILLTERVLRARDIQFGEVHGDGARSMALILIVMTVHSFAEGVAVGVSFGGSMSLALLIVVAIAVHNIPEGIAISAVLRPRGVSVAGCAGWSIASSLPQPIMAVPAFLAVGAFAPLLPYGIGFAAGAMVFMVFEELLPEAYERGRKAGVALLAALTLVGMMVFQQWL